MRLLRLFALGSAAATTLVQAAWLPAPLEKRQTATTTRVPDAACTHGPTTRACWTNGYSIATDFDKKFPTTGNTVTYDLEITNTTCNPDGYGSRTCLLINNQYPGPTIRATWGDTLVINVQNSMQDNGTSIHWHGVRQYHSPGYDGVNGISECPLAPGDTKQYIFQVTQFGTSWYHAHFSSQYGDGVVGTMIFDGPASANYDVDLGVYPVNEWYYDTAYQINSLTSVNLQAGNPPPNANNVLINGTNKDANGNGAYSTITVTAGKKYRLRLINISVDNFIRVSLDGHSLLVMTSDFIPIKPFSTQWLLLAIGQRYDVVIDANQSAGNYWFRADVAADCLSGNNGAGLAVWNYDSAVLANPTTSAAAPSLGCSEPAGITPYWQQSVPSASFDNMAVNLTRQVIVPNGDAITVWALNTTSINVAWERPTLTYLMEGDTNFPGDLNVIPTTSEGSWNYWLIQTASGLPPVPHPIHLHGHDFMVIGSGQGTYTPGFSTLNWSNPPRRDTSTLPGGGWLALAFLSNNPGAWLMHCHIAWHVSEGLGVQFVEAPGTITYPNMDAYNQTCANWAAYAPTAYYQKSDSGI